ncbi:phycocyanin alpha phycocyanobilin lyase, partial [Fischerella thermalis WC217]
MSVNPESVKQLLVSEDLGDRLRAVNQIRQLEPTIGFELIQNAINDSNSRVRYSAV